MKTSICLTVGLFAALTAAASAPPGSAADFAWLAGHWCVASADEVVEEHWLAARGSPYLGMSRTVKNGATVSFEFLRIEIDGADANYLAQPQGRSPTAFRLTASGPGWARFENPRHDFPRRIEYRRSGANLHAHIAGPGDDDSELVIPFEYQPCR